MAWRLLVTLLMLTPVVGVSSRSAGAQDEERTTIRLEAEIITGLEAGGLGTASQGLVQAATGVAVGAGASGQAGGAQPAAGGQFQSGQTAGVDEVAGNLLSSAQSGSLSLADIAMVAALQAGRRSQYQNVEALVTVTVIDASGNITTTTMRNTDLHAEMLGPSIGLGTFGQPIQHARSAQMVLTGDVMRRSSGITYFYVQVCSCGL